MRSLLLILLSALSVFSAHAENNPDSFFDLAQGCRLKNGFLMIVPYFDSNIWHNSKLQFTHSEMPKEIQAKFGDILEIAHAKTYDCYRLDKLTAEKAYFTRWTYSCTRERLNKHQIRVHRGSLNSTETFELDLTIPVYAFVDYPVFLEMSPRHKNWKSK